MKSFGQAQECLPFPVHEVSLPASEISVRPLTRNIWPTLRSVHRYRDARFSLKQYAADWWGHFGAPNKIYTTREDCWELYGPTTELRIPRGSAFHGTAWDGREVASLVTLGMHVEIRVTKGRLGPTAARAILQEVRPIDRQAAEVSSHRPLLFWNWSLQSGWVPGSSMNADMPMLRWFALERRAAEALGVPIRSPTLPGWPLDCIGVQSTESQTRIHLLFRSSDMNTVLEVEYSRGGGKKRQFDRNPLLPLFVRMYDSRPGSSGFRSDELRWAWYQVNRPDERLTVVIPPGRSEKGRDLETVRKLATGLMRRRSSARPRRQSG